MNSYELMKRKHQEEVNNFPIGFAFSNEQFKEMMNKWGLTENDTDKVVSIGYGGGFIKKTDVEAFKEMNKRHRKEEKNAIENDKTGEGYIKDMFESEFVNNEYGYTHDMENTLDVLGLTIEEINEDERLRHGLELALKRFRDNEEEVEIEQ